MRDAKENILVNAITGSINLRDSLWEIEEAKIKDSLKLHPYKGKFRFWVSDVDKAGYSRVTYFINSDSLTIKKGPYDFITWLKIILEILFTLKKS